MTSSQLRARFGALVSAHEIPFPGNRDFGSKRRGSNAGLLSREAEGRIEEVEQERDQAREDRPNALETLVERLIDICLTHHHSIDDVITYTARRRQQTSSGARAGIAVSVRIRRASGAGAGRRDLTRCSPKFSHVGEFRWWGRSHMGPFTVHPYIAR
jgi:hypothetical protein